MKIQLPNQVQFIIHTLENAGFEAYAVGGCVRDSLLNRNPDDWDITTNALPTEVKSLFPRTIDTGIQHGTVTVMVKGEGFEVTTYRIDGDYEDGRHPKEVSFTRNLEEDLKRRDFTINAMAYNDRAGIVDIFHGVEDLEKGVIRAVGNPTERFTEDALRMMRAVRFSAQLGYDIEKETKEAIQNLAPTITKISAERVQVELVKLVTSPHPNRMRLLYETGLTAFIMPEFDRMMKTEQNHPHHCYNVGEHTIHAMEHIKPDKVLRLAMLFHDIGKPLVQTMDEEGIHHFHGHAEESEKIAEAVLKRLKFDNDTTRTVTKLVLYHDRKFELGKKYVRRGINKIGEDLFPLLFPVQEADIYGQSDYMREEKLEYLNKLQAIYDEIIASKDCVSLKTLAVSGSDLIALGMKPGKEIGATLQKLLDLVLEDATMNTKETLLSHMNIQSDKKS